ncbi:NUDIX hydrolase [Erysipelothrix aquatica]|uniref:NUDIX hydrolase n=1 Tax=Erysipelothrix aquatica TaxID=2683714 RepID=UPI001358DEF6|nr:NUDIX domain-containing protein [Erysipelothrix aquatica]
MTSLTYKQVNVVIVFNTDETDVLMCLRMKNPYLGLYNFLGGKKETQETDLEGAYRELYEESGISKNNIELKPLFTTQYHQDGIELQVFYGTLQDMTITLVPEKHPLHWIPIIGTDFADETKFAGQGNIKHMIEIIRESKQKEGLVI